MPRERMEYCKRIQCLFQDSTTNVTENSKIVERVKYSNLLMCSLVHTLRLLLQFGEIFVGKMSSMYWCMRDRFAKGQI